MLTEKDGEEIKKCALDFRYFAKEYCSLEIGEELLEAYECLRVNMPGSLDFLHRNLVYLLWNALFKPDKTMVWLAPQRDESRAACLFFDKYLEKIPDYMKGTVLLRTDERVFEDTNCYVRFWTPEPSKGSRIDVLIMEDYNNYPNLREVWQCFYPCLYNKGKCFGCDLSVQEISKNFNFF